MQEFLGRTWSMLSAETILEARIARRGKNGLSLSQATIEMAYELFILRELVMGAIQRKAVHEIAETLVSAASFSIS